MFQTDFFLQTRIDGIRSAFDGSLYRYRWRKYRLDVEPSNNFGWSNGNIVLYGGLTDDLWVYGQNESWRHRNQIIGMSENYGLMSRADIGFSGRYQRDNWSLQIRMASGEGEKYQERNLGLNTQIQATVSLLGQDIVLFGQEGSRGFAMAPEHRLAMRITSQHDVGYGVEVMKAWGVQGDASLDPIGASIWLRIRPKEGLWGISAFRYALL